MEIGIVVAVVAIAAFGYFLYTRIKASKNRSSGGRGGSRSGKGVNKH